MSNEEFFDLSSEIFDSIPDSSSDQEDSSLSSGTETDEEEQGSDEDAVTPVDTSSFVTVVVDQGEVIKELQRIEGIDTLILYSLYIGIGIFLSVIIIKIIWYFARG